MSKKANNGKGKVVSLFTKNIHGMTVEDYVLLAIEVGRKGKMKGIHATYSGLNQSLREAGFNPVEVGKVLVDNGVIESRPTKGGYAYYKVGDMPETKQDRANNLVAAIKAARK